MDCDMATKKEAGIELDDVVKATKKFLKQGKLDELADAWVENNEKAEQPNKLTNLLGQVGQFIKENDIEDKLEDMLNEGTKTTTKKSSSSTKKNSAKKSTSKKTTKKSTTTKKTSTSTKKADSAKKSSSTKKSTSTKKTK